MIKKKIIPIDICNAVTKLPKQTAITIENVNTGNRKEKLDNINVENANKYIKSIDIEVR